MLLPLYTVTDSGGHVHYVIKLAQTKQFPPPPPYLLCFIQFQLQPVNLFAVFFIWLKKKKKIKIKIQHTHVQSSPFNSKWHLSGQQSSYRFNPSVRALLHTVCELSLSLCTLTGGWPSLVLSTFLHLPSRQLVVSCPWLCACRELSLKFLNTSDLLIQRPLAPVSLSALSILRLQHVQDKRVGGKWNTVTCQAGVFILLKFCINTKLAWRKIQETERRISRVITKQSPDVWANSTPNSVYLLNGEDTEKKGHL